MIEGARNSGARASLRRFLGVGCVIVALTPLLAGCGAEKEKVTPNPNPTAVPGGGMTQEQYRGEMEKRAREMGR